MKHNDAVVGFSVNPELKVVIGQKQGPKKPLLETSYYLSGSSGNVATAIKKLGALSHVLGLVGMSKRQTLADILLPEIIQQSGVSFTPIKILAETNLCIIPTSEHQNKVLWGKRNDVVQSAIPKVLRDLKRPEIGMGQNTFAVITGLRVSEMMLAKALFQKAQTGFRVLSPNHSLLCAKKELMNILPLVDLLVLNNAGFKATGLSLTKMHSYGPRIIVITHDRRGGSFSFPSGLLHKFEVVSFSGGHFETGAGDWFLGALIAELTRIGESIIAIRPDQFKVAIKFAARVAGKKLTMSGGGNGPTRRQLQ